MNHLTDEQITEAIVTMGFDRACHEHPDCIRIAYEWLDAQTAITAMKHDSYALKHRIEQWSGRYVSKEDVMVAAHLHPDFKTMNGYVNVSARLVEPDTQRLAGITVAFSHYYRSYHRGSDYSHRESL